MSMKRKADKPFTISLEEHYWDRELHALFSTQDGRRAAHLEERLFDLGALRLQEMDEAGIDVQVLSHGSPGVQLLDPDLSIRMARQTNDRLGMTVSAHPNRFAAFATLPTPDPVGAADEMERVVTKLGFKGAMLHGLTCGALFLDDRRFWPLFERAERLEAPLYIHPGFPPPAVADLYYNDYATQFPQILGPVLGFTVESATQAIRLVLSGVFDAFPRLQFILGHLGEGLPGLLWRIDHYLPPIGISSTSFREIFCNHFHVTTSGDFSTAALLCAVMEMGADRVMFSVDWPFDSNSLGTAWMETVPLSQSDRVKILGGNAQRLLRI